MDLDYSLITPEDRTRYTHTLPLERYNPMELELCANYILHPYGRNLSNTKSARKTPKHVDLHAEGTQGHEIKPSKGSNKTLVPRTPVPWHHPYLRDLARDIEILKQALDAELDSYRAYKLRSWIRELRMDARERIPNYEIHFSPTFTSAPDVEIEDLIDFTNSFHIKHFIQHYGELRQSEVSKFSAEYFDMIVERTPLEAWEKHLLIRYIDRENAIVVARELATEFNHIVYPGYLSKTMRRIYRLIADEAKKMEVEWNYRDKPELWRKCPNCGEKHPNMELWWRKGQRQCKTCLSLRYKGDETNGV